MNAFWKNLRKKWLLALLIVLILLGGIIGMTVLIEYLRFRFRKDPDAPPAPSAPAAPEWESSSDASDSDDSLEQTPATTPAVEVAPDDPSEPPSHDPGETDEQPSYQWPEGFPLPLKIHFDIPEMPERLLSPAGEDEEP